jgi:AraC-like DNA-binding protein
MPFLLFGSAIAILFYGCTVLPTRNKQPVHYLMMTCCSIVASVALYFWAEITGLILRFPTLAGADIAITFLAGPALYLTALTILCEGKSPVRSYLVYFIVPMMLAMGTLVYNFFTAPAYVSEFGFVPGHFSNPVATILSLSADLSFTAAISLALLAARRLHKAGRVRDRRGFRAQVVLLFFFLSAALLLLSCFVFRSEQLYKASFLLICLIIVVFGSSHIAVSFLPRATVPHQFRDAFRKPTWEEQAEEFSIQLDAFMEEFAPYREERLTLRQLARMLRVEPRRLSYHIHTRHSLNFQGYINEWRLRAVCKDLIGHPEHTILHIAFENGFNSKSSFNTLFHKKYGRTPSEFRKEHSDR